MALGRTRDMSADCFKPVLTLESLRRHVKSGQSVITLKDSHRPNSSLRRIDVSFDRPSGSSGLMPDSDNGANVDQFHGHAQPLANRGVTPLLFGPKSLLRPLISANQKLDQSGL